MVLPLRFIRCAVHFAMVLLLTTSCDKEDTPEKPDNHIIFNGTKLEIKHARLIYNDPYDLQYLDPDIGVTHYNQAIRFTDGDIHADDFHIENGTYKLIFSVFTTMTDHTSEFMGGTFSSVH